MKAQHTIATTTSSNSENNYKNIVDRLTANDPSFIHLDLSKIHLTEEQVKELYNKIQNNNFIGNVSWSTYPFTTKVIVENIENKIIQNNKQYKYYPDDFIHGLLSSHVYINSKDNDRVEFKNNDPLGVYNSHLKGWHVHKVFQDQESGYYGNVYINEYTKQAVLAHRGTTLEFKDVFKADSSLQASIKGVFGKQIVAQQITSYVIAKEVTEYAKENHYNLSFTGYGLGAWMAELSIYFCHRDFNYPKAKAVTFDSPGSVMNMDQLKSNIISHETKFEIENLNIITYLSAPNFVNSCNQHTGKVYRLFPEANKPEIVEKIIGKLTLLQKIPMLSDKLKENAFLLEGLLSITAHNLPNLLAIFDPATGKPIKYEEVLDWPVIKYTPNVLKVEEAQKGFINGLINAIPYSNILPSFVKGAASSVICKAIPDNVIMSLLSILIELVNGDINTNQYFNTYKYLNNKEKYDVKEQLSNTDEFSLSYEGHYRTKAVSFSRDVMSTNNKGSSDWYLSQLAKLSIKKIYSKEISLLLKQQLIELKGQYNIDPAGKKYLCTKSDIIKVENVRESLMRLIEVSAEIKNILEDKYAYTVNKFIAFSGTIASNLPSIPMNNFIYRENIFDQIDDILSTTQLLAISAFAGAGKSTTALEYGHKQKNTQDHPKIVRWFNADSADKINEAYRNFAIELGLIVTSEKEEMVRQLVHNKIADLKSSMLFIFDNVEQYEYVRPYLIGLINIPQKQVQIIITTRYDNLDSNLKHIKLPPFSKVEAAFYIKKSLGEEVSEKDTELLIETLNIKDEEVLPFTLSKTVAYLKENKLSTVEKYVKYIEDNKEDDKIETDLLLKLLEGYPLAWQILQYAAHLDPDFISLEIFKELLVVDEDVLLDSIKKLESLAVANFIQKGGNNGLQLHRLTQETVIKYVRQYPENSMPLEKTYNQLIEGLNNLLPIVTRIPDEKWQIAELFYSHVVKLLNNYPNIKQAEQGHLYTKLGNYNDYVMCNLKQLLKYQEKALEIRQSIYQGNHPDIACSLNEIGYTHLRFGNSKEALKYGEDALNMYQALHQGNHPDIARSLNELSELTSYIKSEDKKTLKYREDALRMYQALYQGNHPDVANSLIKVGIAYEKLGSNPKEQLKYYEAALKMYQALHQGNHPDIAKSLNLVGIGYRKLGDFKKGLQYHEEALKMCQTLYQGNHPDIAKSLNLVGNTYDNLKNTKKALQYEEKALKLYQDIYEYKHPSLAIPLRAVAKSYEKLGDYHES